MTEVVLEIIDKKGTFQLKASSNTGYSYMKIIKLFPYCAPYIKINFLCIRALQVKRIIMNILEDNKKYFHNLRVRNNFLKLNTISY